MSMEAETIESLITLYDDAFDSIFDRVSKKIASGNYSDRDLSLLKSINQQIAKLNQQNIAMADQVIAPLYNKVREETASALQGRDVVAGFDKVHAEAINLTQQSLLTDLTRQNLIIGRQLKGFLRDDGLKFAQQVQLGNMKTKEAVQGFVDKLGESFMVKYRNGSKVNIRDYAKMSIKTTIDSSINRAVVNTNEEYDNDLVRLSWHSTSCPTCAPYQGRVYSISGKSTKYPPLSDINNESMVVYGTIHPNCSHRLIPYVEEFNENKEKIRDFSNEEFKDNRTELSKKRYDNAQKQNTYRRELKNLNQEKKILQNLPRSHDIDRKLEIIERKIKFRKGKVKEIKQFNIDNPRTESNLFTELPPK